ncbi:hypothetical protein BC835DRAFT_1309058 [Cytidiella melzeri]|nr:hypothetical protein BC835DRAFT_1309058 [Cytidiella melzeri]
MDEGIPDPRKRRNVGILKDMLSAAWWVVPVVCIVFGVEGLLAKEKNQYTCHVTTMQRMARLRIHWRHRLSLEGRATTGFLRTCIEVERASLRIGEYYEGGMRWRRHMLFFQMTPGDMSALENGNAWATYSGKSARVNAPRVQYTRVTGNPTIEKRLSKNHLHDW